MTTLNDAMTYLASTIPVAAVTYVLGWITSTFVMSAKDRKDYELRLFETGRDLMIRQQESYQEFIAAMTEYRSLGSNTTFQSFLNIATTGDKYFFSQKIVADAILSGKVDKQSRDNTLIPSLHETVVKSLPTYYEVLQKVASRKGYDYQGKLERKNYESIYSALDKYTPH